MHTGRKRTVYVAVVAMGLLVLVFLPIQSRPVKADVPLSVDSAGSSSCDGCSNQSMALNVTRGDVVVVQVALSPQSVSSRGGGAGYHSGFLTSVTSAWPGMPFQQRYAYNNDSGASGTMLWEDYAIAPITGTTTITGLVNNSKAAWEMVGYSVKGASINAPFDSNTSFPHGIFGQCGDATGCSLKFSTTAAQTLVIAGIASEACPGILPPNGFTAIQGPRCNGWNSEAVAYHSFASPQANQDTGNWMLTTGEYAMWFVDAFQGCVGACPSPPISAVLQPISVGMSDSAPGANVSVNGCQSSPSTFLSNGDLHNVVMAPSCSFALSFSNAGDVRNGFSVSGSFNATSPLETSCASVSCPPVQLTAYQQLKDTYRAKPLSPGNWDADLAISVTGAQLGVANRTGCVILGITNGGIASCSAWFDYHMVVSVEGIVGVSSTERWAQTGGSEFIQTVGGAQDTVNFLDQFMIGFVANPDSGGRTNSSSTSAWENYGPLHISATPSEGYLFNGWMASGPTIVLSDAENASTMATILGTGNITATFSQPVTQPVALTLVEPRGTPANFSITGCSVSPTSIPGDGVVHYLTSLPSCKLTISESSASGQVRYDFSSKGTAVGDIAVTTCPVQQCPQFAAAYYEQVSQEFAYNVAGGFPPYVKSPILGFTSLGAPASYTLGGSPSAQWLDFGSSWSMTNPLTGSSSAERWVAAAGTSGFATPGGAQMTSYIHQFLVQVLLSPADCGTVTPAGAIWEGAGQNFQVIASASQDCSFNAWKETGLVTIAEPDQASIVAFADSNGTISASFTRNAVPNIPESTILASAGGGVVVAAVAAGVLISRSRRLRSAKLREKTPGESQKPT